jgi:phosphatidylserine/phosphatidylglycerophosphate/cardiolipin synthase-like enzyme
VDKLGLRHDRVRHRDGSHLLIAALLLSACSPATGNGDEDVPSGIDPWGLEDAAGDLANPPGGPDVEAPEPDSRVKPKDIAPPQPSCFEKNEGPDFLPFFSKSCQDEDLCPCNPTDMGMRVAHELDKAEKTLDICVMELQDFTVSDAVIAAHKRGVAVRLILDDGYADPAEEKAVDYMKKAGIEIRNDENGAALMHSKFSLIDDDVLLVSSANYSTFDSESNANNLLVLRSPALVQAFRTRFDSMWNNGQYHKKGDGKVHKAEVDGADVEVIFGPDWAMVDRLEKAIAGAKHSVHFSIFAFTLEEVKDAILDRCGEVEIRGVYDAEQGDDGSSVATSGWCSGAVVVPSNVQASWGYRKLHHKVLIVDPGTPSAWVIAGSANWSYSAATKNDEIMIATNHPDIVAAFETEFQARLQEAQ